ncbi:MAG: hypothetical protein ACPGJV_01470 [Bacteriovoracaceae bacterium]
MDANQTPSQSFKSFSQFYRSNRFLFSAIEKKVGVDALRKLLEAVWNERNPEIKHHKNQVSDIRAEGHSNIEVLQAELKSIQEKNNKKAERLIHKANEAEEERQLEKDLWQTVVIQKEDEIKDLKSQLKKVTELSQKLNQELKSAHTQVKESEDVFNNVIQENLKLNNQIERSEKTVKTLEDALASELDDKTRLEAQVSGLEENERKLKSALNAANEKISGQADWFQNEFVKKEEEIRKSQAYAKKYQEINTRLSNEIIRLQDQLETNRQAETWV